MSNLVLFKNSVHRVSADQQLAGFMHRNTGTCFFVVIGLVFFLRVVSFPKEKFISSLAASPEHPSKTVKMEREKLWWFGQALYLHPDGTGLSHSVLKIIINTFMFVLGGKW